MAGGSEAGRRAFLRRVALFASLSDDDLGSLSRAGITDWARAGTAILKEGAPANGVIVLTEGRAKVVIAGQKGQDIILAIVEPLSVVGELALLDRSPRSATVTALERTGFVEIPLQPFEALLKNNRAFAEAIARHLAATLRHANEQLRAICTLPAERRVAWCLRRIARQQAKQDGSSYLIRPSPLQQDIADMTACSRETVSRALAILKRKNCVREEDGGLRVLDGINRHLRDDVWLS